VSVSHSLARLRREFPRTVEAFCTLPDRGESAFLHLQQLDSSFGRGLAAKESDSGRCHERGSFDVVFAGGGLSLIYAAYLSMKGVKVAVFDRRRMGLGHREWNISRRELQPLVASGLFSEAEVQELVLMQYRTGICRFGKGPDYTVSGVLDCVVDAEGLFRELLARCEKGGVTFFPYRTFLGCSVDEKGEGVIVQMARLDGPEETETLRARLFVDALGAVSPHARFDLCCPTVGGVMDGLELGDGPLEMNPEVGEILVTTEGIEQGRQHIWEGFPTASRDSTCANTRQMTIYLFYYLRSELLSAHGPSPLLSLYERYFETLGRYKRGALRLLRPTYGYIPGYTRLHEMPASPGDRIFLVGDAAGRHSPLTFCGFGSMIRSFFPISEGLLGLLERDRLDAKSLAALWFEPPALKVLGGLTLMMSPPLLSDGFEAPDTVNDLLNAAFSSLFAEGEDTYRRFLQDDVDAKTFVRFMWASAHKHPAVYEKAFRYLSTQEMATWLYRLWQLRRG